VTVQPDAQPIAVSTQTGEQATVNLPDDTRIVLNANSHVRYDPDAFTHGPRVVSVTGEVLFDVAPAPERDDPTFRVRTPDGTVRVLGTTFSVTHRGDDTRVVLSEGRVAIDSRLAQRDTTFELKPGDLVSFDRETGQLQRRIVNPDVYTSWASGQLVFDNTPLPEVVARIESTYGVKVVVQDPNVLDRVVSGSVENDLSVLIQGLSQILDRPIDRNGNRIVIR
jgi:ferric-dicitrate binding protein FerR (iron transport regulator)